MRYAMIDGEMREAEHGLTGECRGCGGLVRARCGIVRIKHWAHKEKVCDPWLKDKTEWHIRWQDYFPKDWQEYRFKSETGEIHIADVRTDQDLVIEFQHSPIAPTEQRARESFYKNLIWVVNATRRKRDIQQLQKYLNDSRMFWNSIRELNIWRYDSSLIRDWIDCKVPVYFDFGDESDLWYLLPNSEEGRVYMTDIPRTQFKDHLLGGSETRSHLDYLHKEVPKFVDAYKKMLRQRQEAEQLARLSFRPQFTLRQMRRRSFRL